MLIEKLREFSPDVDEGIRRCVNNEEFYLRMVKMALESEDIGKLKERFDAGDIKGAFACAHNLKGVFGNLSLTPIFKPVSELTELLRSREPVSDDGGRIAVIYEKIDELKKIMNV